MATCPDVSNLPVAGHEARSGRCGSLHTMGKSCRPRDESVGSPKTSTTVRMARTCAPSIEEGVEDHHGKWLRRRSLIHCGTCATRGSLCQCFFSWKGVYTEIDTVVPTLISRACQTLEFQNTLRYVSYCGGRFLFCRFSVFDEFVFPRLLVGRASATLGAHLRMCHQTDDHVLQKHESVFTLVWLFLRSLQHGSVVVFDLNVFHVLFLWRGPNWLSHSSVSEVWCSS